MRFRPGAIAFTAFTAFTMIVLAGGGLAAAASVDDALALYDAGRFAEARLLLEQLDRAAGLTDGSMLYRLAYCQRTTGATDEARATEERARAALESELPRAKGLEVPFYLVNTYRNLGRTDDARRVAAEVTARVVNNELGEDLDPLEAFRVGKLFADQDQPDPAAEWLERALASEVGAPLNDAYSQWAARFLADRASGKGDSAGFERNYTRYLDAGGQPSSTELERIAVTRARQLRYREAAEAWDAALQLQPADSNRVRYSAALARTAARLHPLPDHDASGRPWVDLSKEELESLMQAEAQRVKDLLAEAGAAGPPRGEQRNLMRASIKDARVVFVTAAMEYTLRGNPIRETAFFGGYAPLILSNAAWRLPGKETPVQIID